MKQRLAAIAVEAGRAVLPLFRPGHDGRADATAKPDGSPVTEADLAAERIILERLAAAFPDIPVVSEEAVGRGCVPPPSPRFFLVDPLDGTREFVAGRPDFTVNIGLIEHGVPVAGAVLAPATGQLFLADAEGAERAVLAALRDDDPAPRIPLRVRPPAGGDALRIVASRSHRTPDTNAIIARFPGATLRAAGSSLKFCLIAAGEADVYPRVGPTMEWDTAAADAVLRAAGGRVECLDGTPLRYNKRDRPDALDFLNPSFFATAGPSLPAG